MKDYLDFGLKDKVAIVAGGGSNGDGIGNGRASSILLAQAGAKVLVVDLNKKSAQNTVDLIKNIGGDAFAINADLTSSVECKNVVNEVIKKWKRLDILDNNIGIASNTSVVNENEKYWDKVMNINLKPMFLMSKYSIPEMIKSGNGGVIINISSISATRYLLFFIIVLDSYLGKIPPTIDDVSLVHKSNKVVNKVLVEVLPWDPATAIELKDFMMNDNISDLCLIVSCCSTQ